VLIVSIALLLLFGIHGICYEKTVSSIHDFALNARHLLEQETGEQLEGIYGFLPNGKLEPSEKYPAPNKLPEAAETRARLDQYLFDEQAAGIQQEEAREKLIKEAAYTWLNRLVAFRMMETRELIKDAVAKGAKSNAFLLWLTAKGNDAELKKYEAGDLQQNEIGEGPRQEAYRHFILWQCGELAKEIRVLFDTDNLPSRLFPRPRALVALVEMINREELKDAWAPGNEETVGWVYQFFNEPDLEIFRSQSAPKVPPRLIAPKTQQFTPRWIVRYLVENTLGRLWIEMHPDSALVEKLSYVVPSKGEHSTPLKHVSKIHLLDPACGSMHFGLVSFDLFREMYKEEMLHAGKPGWPEKASVEREGDIPASIIAHNIAGIDLDPRAVQLSALTLYLRAKAVNPIATIRESNLACADIHMLRGETMKKLIAEAGFEQPIFGRILMALGERLKDSEHLGSLLSLEQEIISLIAREKDLFEKEGRQLAFPGYDEPWQPELPGLSGVRFEKEAYSSEFWDALATRIERALDLFASEHGEDHFFVGEVRKGVRYLKVVSTGYDIVATNPPYMDSRDYNPRLKALLEDQYPDSKRNLYACFLMRCMELLNPGGRLGIITPQTFMFISTFEKTRGHLRNKAKIETLVHTGLNTFPNAVVDCAFYTLCREGDKKKREEAEGVYFRLVKEPDGESKRKRLEGALERLRKGEKDEIVYRYKQSDFDGIPGSPWAYWIRPKVMDLFRQCSPIGNEAEFRAGMHGGDFFRFGRLWWEVGIGRIARHCRSKEEFFATKARWVPYMKGGDYRKWWGNQEWVFAFDRRYYEILSNCGNKLPNRQFYFHTGVTWNSMSSKGLSVRALPAGFVFSDKSDSAFAINYRCLLGIMNSSIFSYLSSLISPTIDFHSGYLAKIPFPSSVSTFLETSVSELISQSAVDSREDETTYDFISLPCWNTGINE